jgi:hypothetical protein
MPQTQCCGLWQSRCIAWTCRQWHSDAAGCQHCVHMPGCILLVSCTVCDVMQALAVQLKNMLKRIEHLRLELGTAHAVGAGSMMFGWAPVVTHSRLFRHILMPRQVSVWPKFLPCFPLSTSPGCLARMPYHKAQLRTVRLSKPRVRRRNPKKELGDVSDILTSQ